MGNGARQRRQDPRSVEVDALIDQFEAELDATMRWFAGIDHTVIASTTLLECQQRIAKRRTRKRCHEFPAAGGHLGGLLATPPAAGPHGGVPVPRQDPGVDRTSGAARRVDAAGCQDPRHRLRTHDRREGHTIQRGRRGGRRHDPQAGRGSCCRAWKRLNTRPPTRSSTRCTRGSRNGWRAPTGTTRSTSRSRSGLENLRQRTIAEAQQSIEWLREAFTLAKDVTAAEGWTRRVLGAEPAARPERVRPDSDLPGVLDSGHAGHD